MTGAEKVLKWLRHYNRVVGTATYGEITAQLEMAIDEEKLVKESDSLPCVSGLACKCGNQTFTHRHSNWIECTACNKIQILQA